LRGRQLLEPRPLAPLAADGPDLPAMLSVEGTLLEKPRKVEALYPGTTVDGERETARRGARWAGSARDSRSFAVASKTRSCCIGCPIMEAQAFPGATPPVLAQPVPREMAGFARRSPTMSAKPWRRDLGRRCLTPGDDVNRRCRVERRSRIGSPCKALGVHSCTVEHAIVAEPLDRMCVACFPR
jgi:hypothetical protein